MNRCWLPTILLAVSSALAAADAPPEPKPVVTAETVKALAEKLGADGYDDREAAEAELLKLGEPAWAFLEPYLADERDEIARRTARLGDKIAVVLERDAEKAKEFLTLLRDREDEMKRAKGIDGMMTLGLGGIRAARQELSGAGTKIDVKLECTESVVLAGSTVELKATAASTGEGRFWSRVNATSLRVYAKDVQPFGEPRPVGFGSRCSSCSARVKRSGYYNPIRAWRVCLPGPLESASQPLEAKMPGLYPVGATYAIRQETISPRLPGSETKLIAFSLNKAVDQEEVVTCVSKQVYAVPDVDKLPADPRMSWEAARAKSQDPARAGGVVPITLTFRLKQPMPLQIEQDMLRWAWYCWVNEKTMQPAGWGSLHSALASAKDKDGDGEQEREALATFTIPGHGSATRDLNIPAPQAAGTYRLVLGYEVTGEDLKEFPMEPRNPDADPFIDGHLAVEVKGIVIDAAPAAKPAEPEAPAK